MVNFGKFIAKHSKLIIIICVLLLIPSVYGYTKTRINYDVLSYLQILWKQLRVRTFWLMNLVWVHSQW